jgi:hypothetical protein
MRSSLHGARLLAAFLFAAALPAQQPQNPSPMVEHTRAHPRLVKIDLPGRTIPLELGTLFVPKKLEHKHTAKLLFFFLGGDWLPQLAVSRQRDLAVITVQAGAGSGAYVKLFSDPTRFVISSSLTLLSVVGARGVALFVRSSPTPRRTRVFIVCSALMAFTPAM